MDFDDNRNNDFLYYYQETNFGQDPSKPFDVRESKMQCMMLSYVQSCLNNSNETTCMILEDMLRDYGKLVDDRDGINNFAEATLALLADVRIAQKSFVSGLPDEIPNVRDLLAPLPGDCRTASCQSCPNEVPTEEDIARIFQPVKRSLPRVEIPETKTALPKYQLHVDEKPTEVKHSTSLYGTYKDRSARDPKPNFIAAKNDHCNGASGSGFQRQPKNVKRSFLDPNVYAGNSKRAQGRLNYQAQDVDSERPPDHSNEKGGTGFRTAGQILRTQTKNKYGSSNQENGPSQVPVKKSLGGKGRFVSSKFVPPTRSNDSQEDKFSRREGGEFGDEEVDDRLKLIDPKMVELIRNEIMDSGTKIDWDDIAGLHVAKTTIQEIVVWPMLRPDIFTGLRRPPKGILLFGPPGTGKTLIGKCIASQSSSTFFSISASSLTSKWIGDGEKMVRALFAVARCHQPAVVFIDEIDSLLSQRCESEHESSRRIKTEFLVQLDGAATGEEERILVIGATNRPQELDEAARRRLVKRLYIPLPDNEARIQLVTNLMRSERNDLESSQIEEIAQLSDGYSGADMKNLCQEACLGPIRSITASQMFQISADSVRPVNIGDFKSALRRVRSSVSAKDLEIYKAWDEQYGSGGAPL